MDKMNLGVLLNNITAGGMSVPSQTQSQPKGSINLSGLGSLGGLNNQQTTQGFLSTTGQQSSAQNSLAGMQGLSNQQQNILASHLISSARMSQDTAGGIVSSQPFFNLPMAGVTQPMSHVTAGGDFGQGPQYSLKRPHEDSWQMQQQQMNQGVKATSSGAGGVPGSSEEGGEKTSRRRTVHQLEVLESVFKLCPNPTEARRKQLGQMLKMDERQVVIWFQNKRQRVRAKMKEQENNTLRQQHTALKTELQREKSRELALEQENALLKSCMEEKVKKMEELRQASSELLVEYYKKKGGDPKEWKKHLPSGLMESLKLPSTTKEDEQEDVEEEKEMDIDGESPKETQSSEKAAAEPGKASDSNDKQEASDEGKGKESPIKKEEEEPETMAVEQKHEE